MDENCTYEYLKAHMHSSLDWSGINRTQMCFEQSCFSLKKDHITYTIEITVIGIEKKISICADTQIPLEKLYFYLNTVRRFEYLLDGAFYHMKKCETDGVDVTKILRDIDLAYFSNAKYKHKIPLDLTDKEYKKYFLRWIKLQSKLGIINQMALFANCLNGLTADIRISMLAECFEALGKRLEKEKKIIVEARPNTTKVVRCKKYKEGNIITKPRNKTFVCYITAIIETYGKTIFNSEYRKRTSLIKKIVGTRNKVFHVNANKKNFLDGKHCGFYAIKLEWLFRYIIWLELGVPKEKLDLVIEKEICNFENQFPQLMY